MHAATQVFMQAGLKTCTPQVLFAGTGKDIYSTWDFNTYMEF